MSWAATRRPWAWRPTTARSASTSTSSTCSNSCSRSSATAARTDRRTETNDPGGRPPGFSFGRWHRLADDLEAALVEEAEHLLQVVAAAQDVAALADHRPRPLALGQARPFLDAVERRLGGAAEHR